MFTHLQEGHSLVHLQRIGDRMRQDVLIRGARCWCEEGCQSDTLVRWKPTDDFAVCLECDMKHGMDYVRFMQEEVIE